MKVEQYSLLWRCADSHYGSSLGSVLKDAVSTFRRRPGLNILTRIHRSDVGSPAFTTLNHVLGQSGLPPSDGFFIHVRQQLRSHINYHMLKQLVDAQAVPLELRDAFFSIDLGI